MIDLDTEVALLDEAERIRSELAATEIELEKLRILRADMILALRAGGVVWNTVADIFGLSLKHPTTIATARERDIANGARQTTLEEFKMNIELKKYTDAYAKELSEQSP